MALAFPVSLAAFFGDLGLATSTFHLPEMVETSETTGGEILRADYGPRLWEGFCTLVPGYHGHVEDAAARARALLDARASFLVSPPHKQRPGVAPGAILAHRNGRELRLAAAPGLMVRRGDFLSFTYGSSPTRYALHQAVETVTANVSGETNYFEVTPALRPGLAIGAAVELAAPVCKAIMVPGSLSELSLRAVVGEGLSFRWRQTLR